MSRQLEVLEMLAQALAQQERLKQRLDRPAVIERVEQWLSIELDFRRSESLPALGAQWSRETGSRLIIPRTEAINPECVPLLGTGPKAAEPLDLLEAAATDPAAWDVAVSFAVKFIEEGRPVPPQLIGFVIQALQGKKRPRKRGRKQLPYEFRYAVCLALLALKKVGVHPTRNDGTDPKTTRSGCDRIASLVNKNASTIADVWKKRKQVFAASPGWYLVYQQLLVGE